MKIYIIGCSCSGKTTLAKKLSQKLDMEHIELDEYWWLPGWKERNKEEFEKLVTDKLSNLSDWVIDGNYRIIREIILPQASLIIWLNLPFYLVFWRSFSRTIRRIVTQQKVCNGNQEGLKALFSRDSMPVWIIRSYGIRKRYGRELQNKHSNVVELKNTREINNYISQVAQNRA